MEDNKYVRRVIYGPLAVLRSTGMHPSLYKVFSFDKLLSEITEDNLLKTI